MLDRKFNNIGLLLCITLLCVLYYGLQSTHFVKLVAQPIQSPAKSKNDYNITKNYWVKRKTYNKGSLNDVLQANMKMRRLKHWPEQLYHDDLKCGTKHPLQRDIKSQCNNLNIPYSCCNNDIGKCGNDHEHCKCENCIDYKTIIYPELYEWKTTVEEFNLPMPTTQDTCEFLQQQFTSVTFIGDSLTRHLFEAFLIHLTDDPVNGAMKTSLSTNVLKECQGDYQFAEAECRSKLALDWKNIRANKKYCAALPNKIKSSYGGMFSTGQAKGALNLVKGKLTEKRPLILFGLGGHDSFNSQLLIQKYLDPVLKECKNQNKSKPVFVWLNIVAHGHLKFMSFLARQGNDRIIRFNQDLRNYCKENSILVFESFEMTKGVHSFDGTHYGQALNMQRLKKLLIELKVYMIKLTNKP